MTDIIDFKRWKDQHTDVSDLKINSKIVKALVSAGVDTVGKLTDYTPEQLLDTELMFLFRWGEVCNMLPLAGLFFIFGPRQLDHHVVESITLRIPISATASGLTCTVAAKGGVVKTSTAY